MAIQSDIPPNNPSAFPQDLPPRVQSWKQRNCPSMRACWHVSPSSYNVRNTPDKRTLWRRIAMIFVLFVRTAMSVLTVIGAVRGGNIAAIVIYAILAVLGFWFVAWCLAIIGDAVGERKVLGKLIVSITSPHLTKLRIPKFQTLTSYVQQGRNHFDGFLYGIAIIHLIVIVLWIFVSGVGEGITWLAMGLLIFIVAWITSWPPEYPPTSV